MSVADPDAPNAYGGMCAPTLTASTWIELRHQTLNSRESLGGGPLPSWMCQRALLISVLRSLDGSATEEEETNEKAPQSWHEIHQTERVYEEAQGERNHL